MVSLSKVVKNSGFVEPGEVGHVLLFVELGRVHTMNLLCFDDFAGVQQLHLAFSGFGVRIANLSGKNETLLGVRYPDQFLLCPFVLKRK